MKRITGFYRQICFRTFAVMCFAGAVAAFFLPQIEFFRHDGDNRFTVFLYGEKIGVVSDRSDLEDILLESRRELAEEADGLYMVEQPVFTYEGSEAIWNSGISSRKELKEAMKNSLSAHAKDELAKTYTVKVNTQTVNLQAAEEVESLLGSTIGKYDAESKFMVQMELDPNRKLNVLIPQIVDKRASKEMNFELGVGVDNIMDAVQSNISIPEYMDFEDFETGLKEIGFSEKVEVVEAYVPESDVTDLDSAIELLTMEQEIQQIYKVQSGDTLSEISLTVGIPMDTIVEMNPDKLDDVNSTLQIND